MTLQIPNQLPRRAGTFAVALGLAVSFGLGDAPAEPAAPLPLGPAAGQDSKPSPDIDALTKRDHELEAIRKQQQEAADSEAKLRREIEAISADRRKLNEQLIATAAHIRNDESSIASTEERLKPLDAKEREIRTSLAGRRSVIADVLAALQRMGRQPPPVLLVRPEDALRAVRSAILLGAVLPEMRQQVTALAADLSDLVQVRKEITREHNRLAADLKSIDRERQRLALLIEQRTKQQAETEGQLVAERQRAASLAHDADSLQDLITKLQKSLDPKARAARLAARGAPDVAAGETPDPGRMVPAIAFASAKHMLPLPVNGVKIRDFGATDGVGGVEKGLSFATRGGAEVTSPCDAWVVYAGRFRSYGQLLILDAGGGYHVLLAGMERTSVDIGQFVLTGEPVAVMGNSSKVATILEAGSSQPVLYVEFRKDGTPIDPSPWWAASEGEKVRG